ncbi:helix-turn-helix domain-containing protein [Mesorhizobium sp. RMAD-H1]|uniref:helix-turn-helix domain-containing protein n=1 Tax=Mesorhizobium sp. RMAD-H1 TaxID=2587065 RepID=UPI0017D74268|nr:helix-turn-helix domain-containing protein [Mesorhizobium sp. RMAD-H1]MBB2973708.1 hypothetical protein [Mesorhizobium sp. RMAD-H1]
MLRTNCVLAESHLKGQSDLKADKTGISSQSGSASGIRIRRNSFKTGRCEAVFWRRTSRQDVQTIVLAAKRLDRAQRSPGKRNGPLGSVAIEILELFANLVNFKTGRLEPSIETIMRYLKRSRDAVVRALRALRAYGFIDWLRRYTPTLREGRGPQVRQASNAYRLMLPERAKRFLGRFATPCPLPEDAEYQLQVGESEVQAHRASLNVEQRVLFDIGDTPLGHSLARLGKLIKERESAKQKEFRTIL